MSKTITIETLKRKFGQRPYITREELFRFYKTSEPDLNESTFGWRLHNLKERNVLRPVRRGVYSFSVKPPFQPTIEPKLKTIASRIGRNLPLVRFCVWHTRWINEWMIHQPARFLLLVEVEADAAESIFYFLKDRGYKNIFLNPDDDLVGRYVYEETEALIVKNLVTKSPLLQGQSVPVPSLEKILVDLFADPGLFVPHQGTELAHIFNDAFSQYELNITRMLAYAKRRTREQELLKFIRENTDLQPLP